VQRVDLVAAAVLAPLAQQLGDALERCGEGAAHDFGGAGNLARDVAREAAEPGAHAADHALGLAVAAAMDQLRDLAPGAGGDARVRLAQRDAVPARRSPTPLSAFGLRIAQPSSLSDSLPARNGRFWVA
jgi:hypothetical protein